MDISNVVYPTYSLTYAKDASSNVAGVSSSRVFARYRYNSNTFSARYPAYCLLCSFVYRSLCQRTLRFLKLPILNSAPKTLDQLVPRSGSVRVVAGFCRET